MAAQYIGVQRRPEAQFTIENSLHELKTAVFRPYKIVLRAYQRRDPSKERRQ